MHTAASSMQSPTAEMPHQQEAIVWRQRTRVAFRLVFSYLTLFCMDLLGSIISNMKYVKRGPGPEDAPFSSHVWGRIVPWLGSHVFHLSKVIDPFVVDTDGRYAWILMLVNLALAALATVAWTALDRKRRNYCVVWGWLTVVFRTLLAVEMFYYGVCKVFALQFGRLWLDTLATPLGATGHFGALWNFMASSPGYTRFGGATEILGGLLLLLPELTPLGALVCVGVMTNVFALNMFYDVTVKIVSFHLLLMSGLLLAPYVPRLANVLVWNRTAAPIVRVRLARRAWVNAAVVRWMPLALGLAMLCFMTFYFGAMYKQREQKAALHSDFYGVWEADSFNVVTPVGPLLTKKRRHDLKVQSERDGWKGIIFEGRKSAIIELQDGLMDWVQMEVNPATASMVFTDFGDASWKCIFTTSRPSPNTLLLKGTVNGSAVTISLHREPESKLLKENGKFQWVDPDE